MRSIPWKQMLLSVRVSAVIVWRVPFKGLQATFHNLEMGSLVLALSCLLVLLVLRVYKWHCLLAAAGMGHLRQSLRSLFGGSALGLMTPGRLGELGRCVFVREEERAQVVLLTVFDRLLDFWALLAGMSASLFLVASRPTAFFGLAVWIGLFPVVIGFPVWVSHVSKLVGQSQHFIGRFMGAAAAGMPRISTARFAVMALGTMWAELASFSFLLRAFCPTGFATAVATFPFIVLAGDLPLSFGGIGVREGAAALLLSPYAIPSGAAVDASLLWFVFAMLLPAAVGALWLVAERVGPRVRRWNEVVPVVNPTLAPVTALPSPPPLEAEVAVPEV